MIGFEINFYNTDQGDHICDSEGPFFTKAALRKFAVDVCKPYLEENCHVEICMNEYLGNEVDGYVFNMPLRRTMIKTKEELADFLIFCAKGTA